MSTPADMSKVNLADGSSASFLIRWKGRQEGPFPADVIGAKLAANEISLLHEIYYKMQWVTIRDFLADKNKTISDPNFQIVFATEKQKEKLRFFGCTWDYGITTGQAEDALAECAIQFPDAEATWQKNWPAREDQKEKLRYFGCTWNGDINVGQAIDALLQCAIDFPDKEVAWQFQKKKWSKIPVAPLRATTIKKSETVVSKPVAEIRSFADKSRHVGEEFLPTREQLAEIRAFGKKPPKGLTFQEATTWIEQLKIFFAPKTGQFPPEPQTVERHDWRTAPASEKQKEKLRLLGCTFDDGITVEIAKLLIERHKAESEISHPSVKREALFSETAKQTPLSYDEARTMTQEGWNNWIALHGSYGTERGHKLTYGEARALSEQAWIEWRFQHGRLSPQEIIERQKQQTIASPPAVMWCSKCRKSNLVEHNGRYWCPDCGRFVTPLDPEIVVRLNLQISSTQEVDQRAGEPEPPVYLKYSLDPYLPVEFQQTEAENRRRYDRYVAEMNEWNARRKDGAVKQPEPFPEPPSQPEPPAEQFGEQIKNYDWRTAHAAAMQKEELRLQEKSTASKWSNLFEGRKQAEEVTIQEAAKPQNTSQREIIPDAPEHLRQSHEMYCPVCDGQIEVPSGSVWKKRTCPTCEVEVTPVFFKKNYFTPPRAEAFQEAPKPQQISPSEFTIPSREVQNYAERSANPNVNVRKIAGREPKRPEYLPYPSEPRHTDSNSGLDFDYASWLTDVRAIEAENQRRHDAHCSAMKNWYAKHNWKMDWEPMPFPKPPLGQNASSQEVTIQEVAKPQIQKPATYKTISPVPHFGEWVDRLLARNHTCLDGHWLPVGPLSYHFETLTVDISCQVAYSIESKGYCVEPDARFGNGLYDRDQTLALFKPLDGNPIQPSAAYLGAANLLRLCVLIATADGRVDLVELNAFRQAIENHAGLSLTDQKRLLILEQLLTQELCSSSKTVAKIAKSVSADKRLVIGKLLVEVTAANNFITDGERRVLGKIFKSFEIPPDTLEQLIAQICPSQWPRPDLVQSDVSKNDKWLWNHWRTGHPGVVIDDNTLDKKTWNFNDWKALNARWRDLHDQLVARQKQSGKAAGVSSPETGTRVGSEQVPKKVSWLKEFLASGRVVGASGEQIPKPVATPAPKGFALDMARVYEITSETKEVVAILSVLMQDEPENSITLPNRITVPAPEIPKVSGDGNAAPQPTRFNGLDATFHPILERLLARDSWTKNDFKSLADEFHFMPSKIHDTLNEWADEVLGDFILDGEDPVIIHRELITKETIYG